MVFPAELFQPNHNEALPPIFNKSFLKDLAGTIEPPANVYRNPIKNQAVIERYGRQLLLLEQTIPESWQTADMILTGLLPDYLINLVNNSKNIPHGLQHINRVWQNFCVGCVNNLMVIGLGVKNQKDFMMAGADGVVCHDLLQVDGNTKSGHDHVGAVFASGLIKLAQLTGMTNIKDSQLPLVARMVYHHSYPEGIGSAGEMPDFSQIISDYQAKYKVHPEASFPALVWLKQKLVEHGVDLYGLDREFPEVSKITARILCQELGASDKRDSQAPASMANLRTMMIKPKRPFADFTQGLERHKELIDRGISGGDTSPEEFFDDVSRIGYELVRDLRTAGMSPFEISWLYSTIKRRSEYLPVFGEELVASKTDTVNRKYIEWMLMVEKEAKVEGRLAYGDSIVGILRKIQEGIPWLFIKNQLPEDSSTARITEIVCKEYQAVRQMWMKKSGLQQSLNGHNPAGFVDNINELLEYIAQRRNYLRAPRHPKVPYLPVFVATFGVIDSSV